MANSFNTIILMGNVSFDPTLTKIPTASGSAVVFGLATNRHWTDADGVKQQSTMFINCKAYGRMAETIAKYFKKGKPIFVKGYLKYEQWTAPDESKRSRHVVVVQEFQFLSGDRPLKTESAPTEDSNSTPAEDEPCTEL